MTDGELADHGISTPEKRCDSQKEIGSEKQWISPKGWEDGREEALICRMG
jgi:hypothetical protein